MTYGILFEKIENGELPSGFYYAHIPALGLTTHGEGIDGARAAAKDLVKFWLMEKKAAGESINLPSEFFFSTIEFSKVPYKAREILARLKRAGFVVKRQSGSRPAAS